MIIRVTEPVTDDPAREHEKVTVHPLAVAQDTVAHHPGGDESTGYSVSDPPERTHRKEIRFMLYNTARYPAAVLSDNF